MVKIENFSVLTVSAKAQEADFSVYAIRIVFFGYIFSAMSKYWYSQAQSKAVLTICALKMAERKEIT